MSFSQENGYIPLEYNDIVDLVREGINAEFGTDYTEQTFVGTGYYRYLYGVLQRVHESEIKTSEIFTKLQDYILTTNLKIQRPSVSFNGITDSFLIQGYIASVKAPHVDDAGKIFICVDVDDNAPDYAEKKLEICTLIKDFTAAGMVSQGDQVEAITLSNGQAFDFKFVLPDRKPVLLRLTLNSSPNVLLTPQNDEELRLLLKANIDSRYRLGWDFEPNRYFNTVDAPWAGEIILEYSFDTETPDWKDEVYNASYDDLITFDLEDIEVLIDP